MRLKITLPIIATAFALTACGSDADTVDGDSMSADEVVAEMDDAELPEPGQYRSTQELLELDVPGMEQGVIDVMRAQFAEGALEENTYCLTPEEAANGREEMLSGMTESDCDVIRFDVSGNSIDAALSCPTGQGASGDVTINGTMASDSADMVMAFTAPMPGLGDASIRMRVVTERIGECS